MKLQARIEEAISAATGEAARFASSRTATGGCINDSSVVTLEDGREFFIKLNSATARLFRGGIRGPVPAG